MFNKVDKWLQEAGISLTVREAAYRRFGQWNVTRHMMFILFIAVVTALMFSNNLETARLFLVLVGLWAAIVCIISNSAAAEAAEDFLDTFSSALVRNQAVQAKAARKAVVKEVRESIEGR